jgi:hypothetical protein
MTFAAADSSAARGRQEATCDSRCHSIRIPAYLAGARAPAAIAIR